MQEAKAKGNKWVVELVLTCCLILVLGYILGRSSTLVIPSGVWILPFIYLAISLLTYRLLASGAQKSPHRFVLGMNLSVLIKLLTSASICAIYFALGFPEKITFAIAVLLNYVIFTIVLMRTLLKTISHGKSV